MRVRSSSSPDPIATATLAVAIRDVTGSAPEMLWHRETELPQASA